MATEREYQEIYDRIAALRQQLASQLASQLVGNPALADEITRQVDQMFAAWLQTEEATAPPPDKGLAELIGLGPNAADSFGKTRVPLGVKPYDETVTSERVIAVGDLYYIYQHERIGVFRVMRKLRELFKAGTVRLSSGPGAYALYQFDRREVLRFTRNERLAAYRRMFGYGDAALQPGARANTDFHALFTHFINQVTMYWRDKRVSDVIRTGAFDPSFGSIAIVRRSGMDLRNNVKNMSYGHINVLRVEVMQLLDESFRILGQDDVRALFGADNAWDVIEEVLTRYFNERLVTSPRQRMAIAGREVLRWLAQPHLLQTSKGQFEALLHSVAEYSEEWLTSAQAMGFARRTGDDARVRPSQRPVTATPAADAEPIRTDGTSRDARPRRDGNGSSREYEYEL